MRPSYTRLREEILNTVNLSEVPVSAQAIHDQLGESVNLATVYRALHFLENNAMLEAFTMRCSRDGVMRYYYRKEEPHLHFFHCESCHRFSPLSICPAELATAQIEASLGCRITHHVLYYTGLCAECIS